MDPTIIVGELIARLDHERFHEQGNHVDRAYCRGWNDRGESIARDLRIEICLRELKSAICLGPDADEMGER